MALSSRQGRVWLAGLLLMAALLGAIAGMKPVIAVVAPLAVLFAGLVLADLSVGVVVFTVTTFTEFVPGLAKGLGVLIVVSWLVGVAFKDMRGRDLGTDHPWLTVCLMTLAAWVALSAIWAPYSGAALGAAVTWGLNLMLLPIIYAGVRRIRVVELIFATVTLGTLLTTVGANVGLLPNGGDPGDASRLSGAGINPNELGGLLVLGAVFSAGLAARRERSAAARAFWLVMSLISGLGLALTLSRGALVGMFVSLLVTPLLIGRGRRLPALTIGLTVAAAVALSIVALIPATAASRLTASDNTGSGRTDIWRVGLRMWEAHPVTGIGAGNFAQNTIHFLLRPGLLTESQYIVTEPKVAHNIYLQVLCELGVVGLALFLAFIGACVAAAIRACNRFAQAGRRSEEMIARALSIALVGFLAAEFFSSQIYSKALYLMLALGPALLAISGRAPDAPVRRAR